MVRRLTSSEISYAIKQCYNKGRSTSVVAEELRITQRHVQRLVARFKRTGTVHVPTRLGRRPTIPPFDMDVKAVLHEYGIGAPLGVVMLTRRLWEKNQIISYGTVYRIMREDGLIIKSAAKSRRRKWVRSN